jgi:carbon monoxide dehydrogenase subunit G
LSSALAEAALARYGALRHSTVTWENSTMDMKGSQRIEAVPETVWVALNDVDVLKACIPGCETINKKSDTEMDAKVTLKIGPVKASFTGKVTLSDLDPPHGYTITGEGSGGAAGHAKGGAKVRLEPIEGDATMLHYEVSAQIGGKIAQLGSRLIDATAKKLAGDFFQKFGNVVGPVPDNAPEAEKKGWFKKMLG